MRDLACPQCGESGGWEWHVTRDMLAALVDAKVFCEDCGVYLFGIISQGRKDKVSFPDIYTIRFQNDVLAALKEALPRFNAKNALQIRL